MFSAGFPRRPGGVIFVGRVSFPLTGSLFVGGELGVVVEGFSPTWSGDSGGLTAGIIDQKQPVCGGAAGGGGSVCG